LKKSSIYAIIILVILIASFGYLAYGYENFSKVVNPKKNTFVKQYIVIQYPNASFLVLSGVEYVNLTIRGWKPPEGSKAYLINLRSYVTGIPEVDLNITFKSKYDKFTIIVGSPEVRKCSSRPQEFYGNCEDRTLAVTEITVMTSYLFKRYYYWKAIKEGMSESSAREYAYKETMKRKTVKYLSFLAKVQLGLGKLGNRKHLCVLILGPAEGAEKSEIIIPRPGLVIIKGKSDGALRAEAVLIEHILGLELS